MSRVVWGLVISVVLLGGGHGVWSHEAKAPYPEAVRAYSQHRDAEALNTVKRALSIYPNYAEAHFLLGLIAVRQNKAVDATEAITTYEKALALQPRLIEARQHLAYLYEQAGRLDDAEAAYRQVVQEKPSQADAWLNLGVLAERRKQTAAARQAYEAAIRAHPNFLQAHYNAAMCYEFYLHDPSKALGHYRQYVALGGNDVRVLQLLQATKQE